MAQAIVLGMNLHNALGFAGLGLVMKFLPVLFPSTVGSGFGDSNRGLWLAVMSVVMFAIGAAWFARKAFVEVRARFTWTPATLAARRAAANANAGVQAAASRARLSV